MTYSAWFVMTVPHLLGGIINRNACDYVCYEDNTSNTNIKLSGLNARYRRVFDVTILRCKEG